ncbi:MAG: hypothetical protein ACYTEX_25385 [Planctomycetota bacterium]|jgi:hypothetical protein
MKIKKATKISLVVTGVFVAMGAGGACQAGEGAAVQWGKNARSAVLDANELGKMRAVYPAWKVKQSVWPSVSEISTKSVEVEERLKVSCMGWLRKFMSHEQVPEDLDAHLVAMKNWGLIRKESEQKRLCDVFVARFKKHPYVVHVQESAYNVVMAIAYEQDANRAATDHRNHVVQIAGIFLNKALKPNPNSENFHVSETVQDGHKLSKVVWLIDAVAKTDEKGRACGDPKMSREIGASVVRAETDGKFVRFELVKRVKGKRSSPDPYVERFGPGKRKPGSQEKKGK